MDLPPDKIQALRRVVDEHLREGGVYDEIRGLLSEYKAQEGDILHSDGLLGVIEEKGIIQRILDSISGQQLKHKKSSVATGASFLSLTGFSRADGKRQSERRHLRVQLVGGRAFLEHLDIDPSIRSAANEKLFACVQFGGQRFKSRGVDCVCDPPFDDEFFVDLDKEIDEGRRRKQAAGAGGTITKGLWQQRYAMPTPRNFTGGSSSKDRALLDVSTQLHIVLIRVDETLQKRRYVGENVVEWRNVLKTGAVNLSVEIGGSGQGLKVPIDAWVALGVDSKGNNASAVLTRMPKQGSGSGENMYDVRYWDDIVALYGDE
eukprot:gene1711-2583_t